MFESIPLNCYFTASNHLKKRIENRNPVPSLTEKCLVRSPDTFNDHFFEEITSSTTFIPNFASADALNMLFTEWCITHLRRNEAVKRKLIKLDLLTRREISSNTNRTFIQNAYAVCKSHSRRSDSSPFHRNYIYSKLWGKYPDVRGKPEYYTHCLKSFRTTHRKTYWSSREFFWIQSTLRTQVDSGELKRVKNIVELITEENYTGLKRLLLPSAIAESLAIDDAPGREISDFLIDQYSQLTRGRKCIDELEQTPLARITRRAFTSGDLKLVVRLDRLGKIKPECIPWSKLATAVENDYDNLLQYLHANGCQLVSKNQDQNSLLVSCFPKKENSLYDINYSRNCFFYLLDQPHVLEDALRRHPNLLNLAVKRSVGREASQALIKRGFDAYINKTYLDGNTPLHTSVGGNAIDHLKILAQVPQANLNARNSEGYTPFLYLAATCSEDSVQCAQYLLDLEGVDLHARDSKGNTALDLAVRYGFSDKVLQLIMTKLSPAQKEVDSLLKCSRSLKYVWQPRKTRVILQYRESQRTCSLS